MRVFGELHCFLTLAPDVPGCWIAWCPEMDIITQGDHPNHATAMLEEAVRMVIEDCINNVRATSGGEIESKRVTHPLRFGLTAQQDECWPKFQEMVKLANARRLGWFNLEELRDGLDEHILVSGNFDIETRAGVARIYVYFHDHGNVPEEKFVVSYREAFERKGHFSIRSSVLRSAGKDSEKLVTQKAASHAKNAVGEMKVERPLAHGHNT